MYSPVLPAASSALQVSSCISTRMQLDGRCLLNFPSKAVRIGIFSFLRCSEFYIRTHCPLLIVQQCADTLSSGHCIRTQFAVLLKADKQRFAAT